MKRENERPGGAEEAVRDGIERAGELFAESLVAPGNAAVVELERADHFERQITFSVLG